MSKENFVIVRFVDEDDAPSIVASKWIVNEKTCHYPNVRTDELKEKLARKCAEPDDTWPLYSIKILKSYETYGEARLHLKKAEDTSNLESDDEVKKRKRKIRKIYLPEDSDSNDESKSHKVQAFIKSKTLHYPSPPKTNVNNNCPPRFTDTPEDKEEKTEKKNQTDKVLTKKPQDNLLKQVEDVIHEDDRHLSENTPPPRLSLDITTPSSFNRAKYLPDNVNSPRTRFPSHARIELFQDKTCPSGCAMSKQFAVQQAHLIQVVTDQSSQIAELNRKIDLILARSVETLNRTEDTNFNVPDFLTCLPVKDDQSFCHLNDLLKDNQNKKAILKFLAGIGGRNIRTLITNMLRRILLDEVAEKYSLTGKQMKNSNKKPFVTTETCQIIFLIGKRIYDQATEEKMKEITSDWLNQAKIRTLRRAERQKTREVLNSDNTLSGAFDNELPYLNSK